MMCYLREAIFAHCTSSKGMVEDQYVTNFIVQNIEWLGHKRMIPKADNEASLHVLVDATSKMIRLKITHVDQISAEYPPECDSQSNGGIETAVRILRGRFRMLEARIQVDMPVHDPVMA